MSLTKPRAILFDWDNTLVDTWPMIHTALNMTLRRMEHPEWSLEKVRSEVKQSMRDSFPAMFGDRWKEAADFYQASYRSIHLDTIEPLHGVRAMFASIPEDVFVGVVSNKQGATLRKEMAHLQWEERFAAAVGASDAVRDKPDAAPVLLALHETGIAPGADVWFVGDTGVDLACAKATGCTPVLYGDHAITTPGMHDGFPFAAHARDHDALRALIEEAFAA